MTGEGTDHGILRRFAGVIAICGVASVLWAAPPALAGPPTDATFVVQQVEIPTAQAAGAAVPCPAGQRVIGGGVNFSWSYTHVISSNPLDESGRTADTDDGDVARYWYSAVFSDAGGGQLADFYAICSAASDATVQASDFFLESNEARDDAVGCPAGQRVISGGIGGTAALANGVGNNARFRADGPLNASGDPATAGDVASTWRSGADNITASQKSFVAFAICSADSEAIVRASDVQTTFSNPSARCLDGERALGGGWLPLQASSYTLTTTSPIPGAGTEPVGWYFWQQQTGATPSSLARASVICEPAPPATEPPPGGAAATTGQQSAALKKCKKKKSAKKRKKCRKRARRLPV